MKLSKLADAVYGNDLFDGTLVYLFRSREKYMQAARQLKMDVSIPDTAGGIVSYEFSKDILMGIFNKDAGTLAHECIHAAWKMLHFHGVQVDCYNHEALAYTVGCMIRRFK